mmetsp:Transcript_11335/g.31604  ORF Transcript_11335/g.31604 Transcript_11335/m.31604 type:complete len:225 (+) Transcript_11335:1705-2379(+)
MKVSGCSTWRWYRYQRCPTIETTLTTQTNFQTQCCSDQQRFHEDCYPHWDDATTNLQVAPKRAAPEMAWHQEGQAMHRGPRLQVSEVLASPVLHMAPTQSLAADTAWRQDGQPMHRGPHRAGGASPSRAVLPLAAAPSRAPDEAWRQDEQAMCRGEHLARNPLLVGMAHSLASDTDQSLAWRRFVQEEAEHLQRFATQHAFLFWMAHCGCHQDAALGEVISPER